jgi:hypothetical protein
MSEPFDPKPVRIRYPDGSEEMGLWVSESQVEGGGLALHLKLRETIMLDGSPFFVAGTQKALKNDHGIPGVGGAEVTVRIRVVRELPA